MFPTPDFNLSDYTERDGVKVLLQLVSSSSHVLYKGRGSMPDPV